MTENVRLQNLRDFTVQIRRVADDSIVGTGIAVSTDGKIVTCAHVVEAALGVHPRKANGAEVVVYFPQVRGGEEKKRKATIEKCFPKHDDDIVLLRLKDGASPLAPEQIAVIGTADVSEGNNFLSYGYRMLGDYPSVRINGMILGHVLPPEKYNLLSEPIQLQFSSTSPGIGVSGAAVLDIRRNLVVGIVSESFMSALSMKDRGTAFAVDTHVLSFAPFEFSLQDVPLELRSSPSPRFDIAQAEAAVFIKEKFSWNNAPSVLAEWTGRDDLLKQITDDWNNPKKHVTGLIGFGGEGKSSLARKWVDDVVASTGGAKQSPHESGIASQSALATTLDGVFWWGFYENRSVDEFLEAALKYMSGGRIDPRAVPSSNLRAQIIGAMLGTGRYLFVLDGLEVMQHQEGDQYGLLQSNDLRDLLTFFARPDNQSFCLITSRAPLLDLMEYTTYTHRDVDRLSEEDGRALLRRLGVQGSDEELNKVVADWDGHVLTLSILAAYLTERYKGDIKHLADIPIPTADEPHYERVHRVLRRYDEHLTVEEREFLKLFSVFRLPVQESAFEKVFEPLLKNKTPDSQFTDSQITEIVNRLVAYRIIHHDEQEKSYTIQPLIRNHYLTHLKYDTGALDTHLKIKDYYLSILGDTPRFPTLDDLKPLIEVVHHTCKANMYDEAWRFYWQQIAQQSRYVLTNQIGSYETELALMLEFFSFGDTTQDPQVSIPDVKRYILNKVGLCLMNLGKLRTAIPFYERSNQIALELQNWQSASYGYQNLAEIYAILGSLEDSAGSAQLSFDLARRVEDKRVQQSSLALQGFASSLIGNIQIANDTFAKAEKIAQENNPEIHYLYGVDGVNHANHLCRTGQFDYARRVIESNLKICEQNHWVKLISQCHRILGDINTKVGNQSAAQTHYESAIKIAQGISNRPTLIEALLGRGMLLTQRQSIEAFEDLVEALGYSQEGGYSVYEVDARIGLARAHLGTGNSIVAVNEAERAQNISREMKYFWGVINAKEIISRGEKNHE